MQRLNERLQQPLGYMDRILVRASYYWTILVDGYARKNAGRCLEAIRIQSEEWFIPTLVEYHRLNVPGIAMTNFCRNRGIDVPAIEPIIPEALCLKQDE